LMTSPPPGPGMSVWAGTGIVAGGLIVGAIISADMTRFNRSGADVVKQTVVGVTLGEFVIGLSGVLLAHATASGDIVAIITTSVGFVGLLIVITGTLKINDWNLYSSTLGLVNFISTAFGKNLNRVSTTIVLGVVGSVLAAAGILGQLTGFLTLLSVAFPPIAGIMVAEYFIVKRWRPELESSRAEGRLPATAPRVVPATIIIWVASSVAGYFITWGIPAVFSLLISMVLYVIAGKLGWVRSIGSVRTRQPADTAESA
ncbi:MAG: cytosine permease, partial [Leucobacter sp.]|nr:cytosine permease [Leucobacter sp.]